MILGLLAMVTANAAATMGALSITRKLSTGRGPVDVVIFLLGRTVLISAAVLAVGLARLLNPAALGLLGGAGIAVWFAAGEQRRLPRIPGVRLGALLATAVALIGARLLVQVWLFAPFSVDPLSYHLPKVAAWVQQGALLPFPGADVRETFPASFELLETWWTVFLHHDLLIEMAGVEFLVLGAAATAALASFAGLGARASALAAVLYALTPACALQATACMNDGAVAALVLSVLALAAFRVHPLLLAAAVAAGLGIKPTCACVLPGAALLLLLGRKTPSIPLPRRSWAAGLAALAVLVGAFWYGLNLVQHGNPLYPVGSLSTVGKASTSALGFSSLLARMNHLAGSAVYDEADHYTVQFIVVAGWGALMFACGGVALVATLRVNPRLRRLASAFAAALIAALLLAPAGSFYLRFILFVPALGAVAVAALSETLPRLTPIVWTAAALSFLASLYPGDLNRGDLARLFRQGWRDRAGDSRFSAVPPDAVVACLRGTHDDSNGESYLAYGPAFSRRVVYLDPADAGDDLVSLLRARNATWIFPQARSGDGALRVRVLEAARQGILIPASGGLYRVGP